MKFLFLLTFVSSAVFSAEVCTYKGKPMWEKKTGLVKCTNFRGIPVKDFEITKGKQDGLQRSYLEDKLIGIAWFITTQREPVMEIGFDDYGNVALITCGKKAYTNEDAKYCGFKGPFEHKFTNFKGELAKKATYLNGEIIHLVTFFSSGKTKEEMKLIDGKKRTTVYHEDGTKSAEALEVESPIWEKEYFTENRLKSETDYELVGEDLYLTRKKYYKNGKLSEEGKYHAATTWSKEYPVGEHKKFHENGELSSSESFDKKGDLDGFSKFFDNDGRIVKKMQYSNNKLIKEEKL